MKPHFELQEKTPGIETLMMIERLRQAWECVRKLHSMGFAVQEVVIGHRNPRVEIQPCFRCQQLGGVAYRISQRGQGQERGYSAQLMGCEVRWSEAGRV